MKKEIELLKHCAGIFEEMDAISWDDDSGWQCSSYEEVSNEVYNYLNDELCECTEFQSCEKCAIKTEWLPIELNKMARGGEYWFKDADNNTCMGIANKNINLYPRTSSGEMGCPTEYAEIKPPKVTTQ